MPSPPAASRAPLRAAFLSRLPQTPEVEQLATLFEQGNYAELRARAARLGTADTEVRRAADELVARTRPAPLLLWLFFLSGLLLTVVTAFAYGKS